MDCSFDIPKPIIVGLYVMLLRIYVAYLTINLCSSFNPIIHLQKRSQELIGFLNEAQEDLGFSTSHLNILNRFLNPDNMIKEEETPAEVLEYTKEEGNIIPKQPTSSMHKRDPIWELFFNTDNGTSLCNKLVIETMMYNPRFI